MQHDGNGIKQEIVNIPLVEKIKPRTDKNGANKRRSVFCALRAHMNYLPRLVELVKIFAREMAADRMFVDDAA